MSAMSEGDAECRQSTRSGIVVRVIDVLVEGLSRFSATFDHLYIYIYIYTKRQMSLHCCFVLLLYCCVITCIELLCCCS